MGSGRGNNNGGRGGNQKGRGGGGGHGQNGNGGAGAKTCNKCQKVGHLAAECRSNGNQPPKWCANCKMANHNTADCTRGANENKNNKQANSRNTYSRSTRPCRFCQELHMDKECPSKNVRFSNRGLNYEDSSMKDVSAPVRFSSPYHHYNGQQYSNAYPTFNHQPQSPFIHQIYPPAQPAQFVQPISVFGACDDIDEEFVTGDPWHPAPGYGQVDGNYYPHLYAQPHPTAVYLHMQQYRVDVDGDVMMEKLQIKGRYGLWAGPAFGFAFEIY